MNRTSRTGRPEDLKEIDTDDLEQVERLADDLGVTTTTLLAAIDAVGTRLDKVRDYLGR
jgi:hypothetical protein